MSLVILRQEAQGTRKNNKIKTPTLRTSRKIPGKLVDGKNLPNQINPAKLAFQMSLLKWHSESIR